MLDATEANWQSTISIKGRLLNKNPTPTLLGVRFDWQLTLNATCQKATQRLNLFRTLGGYTWGWNKKDLCTVYIATQRSVMKYAAPAWAPWMSATNIHRLERVQYAAARSITSQLRSTPLEALIRKATLPTMATRYRMLATIQTD